MDKSSPIGVFDSGVGGLSVFKELTDILPEENYIYYGDTANLPYGSKSKEELIDISLKIFDYFESQNVKAVVMACNTTSAVVYETIKLQYDFNIYPVVQSVSKCIAEKNYKNIGVFATDATINSHAYRNEIQSYNKFCNVFEIACPYWVSIVENELMQEKKSKDNIKMRLDEMMKNNVEKIILGCTHYPYLISVLSEFVSKEMFINPAKYFAEFIAEDLKNKNLLNTKKSFEPKFYVSSNPNQFVSASKLFYNVDNAKELHLTKILVS